MSPVDFSQEPLSVFPFSLFSPFLKKGEKRGNLEIIPRGVQRLTPPCDLRTKPEHNGATSHRAAGTEPRRGIIASNNTIKKRIFIYQSFLINKKFAYSY